MKPYPPPVEPNNPLKEGNLASWLVSFGPMVKGLYSWEGMVRRYCVFAIHTTHGIEWRVLDALDRNPYGMGQLIRQSPSYDLAVKGLTDEE